MAVRVDSNAGDDAAYNRRVNAWIWYDWANSAFVTTVLAALLPVYFSSVAGATLPSRATATGYWSLTLSAALLISAFLSPILGTVADVIRAKKRFLGIFTSIGVVATALLVLVNTGDWVLAALLSLIGNVGLNGALVFYDSLLPHVAKPADQDMVSAKGYALGYLGGGILLAINVAMFQFMGNSPFENAGVRLSFLSVAVWWAVFSLPVFRHVPEPPSAQAKLQPGETIVGVSFARLRQTFTHLRQYRELFIYLIGYLIYSDAIGTIISLAAVYGAELGFGLVELVLALLLVQFVGIPFSLVFDRLPNKAETRRPYFLAFILFNAVMLPVAGILLSRVLPEDVSGQQPAPYATVSEFSGEGDYSVADAALKQNGAWETSLVTVAEQSGGDFSALLASLEGTSDKSYAHTSAPGDALEFSVNGHTLDLTYAMSPAGGILAVEEDGKPVMTTVEEDGADVEKPLTIDTYNPTIRYGNVETITLPEAGQHTLRLVNTGEKNADSSGTDISIASVKVLPPERVNSLPTILGLLIGLEVVAGVFAYFFGGMFAGLADTLDTRRSILLSLIIYGEIAAWGYFLNSTVEYWFLAWMVAIVQGGSQALSRSLYASLSPASKSGEFFGLFSIMQKSAAIIGPLLFALAIVLFNSSRPAILSLVVLFAVGGYLLTRVNIEAGQRQAQEEDAAALST